MIGRDDDARRQKIDVITHSGQIASLNDALRRYRVSGRLTITAGVAALGKDALPAIFEAVANFTAFGDDNDPYGGHDFGAFDHNGRRLLWKIDYYGRDPCCEFLDPANPVITAGVLTIMLAEEY